MFLIKNIVFFTLFISMSLRAQETDSSSVKMKYGNKGFELSTYDGNYKLQLQSRLQFRFFHPTDSDPVTLDDFKTVDKPGFKVNRARLKVGGNAYKSWIKFYWEYELAATNLLDFRLMVEKFSFLKLKVGQWKIQYNRERIISSGKQQTVERSILTKPFTIDRQQGVSLYGRFGSGILDFNYWVSVLTGTGRGSRENDDDSFMYMSRLQWNLFGRELKFAGSDIAYTKDPTGLLAFAGVTNRSPYTRFSQAGGGQLYGYEEGEEGQYRVNQFLFESAFMFRGFSWQQEFHWKEIDDKKNLIKTHLMGNLVQAGYFLHSLWEWFPQQLEVAARYSIYFPDRSNDDIKEREYAFDINWFFNGHLNKLSAEVSHLAFQNNYEDKYDGWRYRIQWDVSI